MPQSGRTTETTLEACQKLRRQRYFRQQNKRRPAGFKRARNRFEINFRFTRAGDPVQHMYAETLLRDGIGQRHGNALLIGCQLYAGEIWVWPRTG